MKFWFKEFHRLMKSELVSMQVTVGLSMYAIVITMVVLIIIIGVLVWK